MINGLRNKFPANYYTLARGQKKRRICGNQAVRGKRKGYVMGTEEEFEADEREYHDERRNKYRGVT